MIASGYDQSLLVMVVVATEETLQFVLACPAAQFRHDHLPRSSHAGSRTQVSV